MRLKMVLGVAATSLALTVATSLPAMAADSEQGYRYPSSCTIGTENRPAVSWRAIGGTILITPPGMSGTPNDPYVYSSPSTYASVKNGGLMAGGKWVVYSTNDVDQAKTFGSCTS